MELTPKQTKYAEAKAQMLLSGKGSNSDALRESYDCDNMTEKTVHEMASKVNGNYKVRTRVAELLDDCKTSDITPELIEKGLLNEALQAEIYGQAPAGSGVSCATCHLPRRHSPELQSAEWFVEHNPNANLEPNEAMIEPICMQCHGIALALNALSDRELIASNFTGKPIRSLRTLELVRRGAE